MDKDTVFRALTNGERVKEKYRYYSVRQGLESIVTLTDYRLFTRLKRTFCCCFHRSSYSAIALETIHSIEEDPAHPRALISLLIWVFWLLAGAAGVVLSYVFAENTTRIIGIVVSVIPLVLTSIVVLTCICCCSTYRILRLTGTFGSREILLEKQQARLFEAALSEQIFQAKLRFQSNPTSPPPNFAHYSGIQSLARDKKITVSSW